MRQSSHFRLMRFAGVVAVAFLSLILHPSDADDKVDFGRDIRPILSDKCFACHGPDENSREGGFRLDIEGSAFGDSDSGAPPIVAGEPENSELIRRILSDGGEQMPPIETEKPLTENEIRLLRRWIAEGATWSQHWAFVAPVKTTSPPVNNSDWISNPIDSFVLQRLESRGLKPAEMAVPETLIRRVTLDLTGLPPTPAEVDLFIQSCANHSTDVAYEKLVDRLLDSPHYSEQMASRWLDAARFADSNGYQNDFGRAMWPWRDWVIHSFESNQPYDQFIVEQIAGDLLPNASIAQLTATGFNRNHRSVTEGGSIEEEWRVENVVDRVETTATVFLGLTMGCARCHDHKYDPISQEEFYQFFAYFNSIDEKGFHAEKRGNVPPMIAVPSKEYQQRLDGLDQRLASLHSEVANIQTKRKSTKQQWRREFLAERRTESAAQPVFECATGGANDAAHHSPQLTTTLLGPAVAFDRLQQSHLTVASDFEFDSDDPFSVSAWILPAKNGAMISRMDQSNDYRGFDMLIVESGQLEVHLIHKWPVDAIKITSQSKIPFGQWTHVCLTYDGNGNSSGFKIFFNQQSVDTIVDQDSLTGTTTTEHPIWVGLRGATPPLVGQIASLRVFGSKLAPMDRNEIFSSLLRPIVSLPVEEQDEHSQKLEQVAFSASLGPTYSETLKQIAKLQSERVAIVESAPTTMILRERNEPRETFVLNRGQYDQPDVDKQIYPGIPGFLPQPDEQLPPNRLGLARWLVDSANPLTARVVVNRFWQSFFGVGLLETPENFGVQSPAPLHQELLDWLAVHFVESGWDVKLIQKTIVMSSTYRQSSIASPSAYEADPANAFLARGPRFRLPAESIRDSALAISGLLNKKIGGPSVKPYQPEGLWLELAGGASQGPYVQAENDDLYRRSLYIYRKRTVPPPTMTTFDAGSREVCQVARPRTNTPLQALALLNDKTYVEAARRLAEHAIKSNDNLDQQIACAFRLATSRFPDTSEQKILMRTFENAFQSFESAPELALTLIAVGRSDVDPTADPRTLAAMSVVCSLILNLDETITKE